MQASLARKPRGMDAGLCAQKLDITSKTAFIAKGRPVVEQWGGTEGRLLVVQYRGRRDRTKPKTGVKNFVQIRTLQVYWKQLKNYINVSSSAFCTILRYCLHGSRGAFAYCTFFKTMWTVSAYYIYFSWSCQLCISTWIVLCIVYQSRCTWFNVRKILVLAMKSYLFIS